jgi:hypothetical protein
VLLKPACTGISPYMSIVGPPIQFVESCILAYKRKNWPDTGTW